MEIKDLTEGQRVKMLREIAGYSQEKLGELIGFSSKTISSIETSGRETPRQNIKILADFFEVSEGFIMFGYTNDIESSKIEEFEEYLITFEKESNLKLLLDKCKEKIINDNVTFKKEYLPIYDKESECFVSFGIFDKSSNIFGHRASGFTNYDYIVSDNIEILNDINNYQYDSKELAKYNLTDILLKYFSSNLKLSALTECNDLEIFKKAYNQIKNKKIEPIHTIYGYKYPKGEQSLETQLNYVLENLNPNLSNYHKIILFLIEHGAYYEKENVYGSCDAICTEMIKDVSKTNLVYSFIKNLTK